MAGCFGNHPYDRHMERELDRYLKTLEDNPFTISGTITYVKDDLVVVEPINDEFETRFEADNEVTDFYIENFCRDNGLTRDQITDYNLDVVYTGDEQGN